MSKKSIKKWNEGDQNGTKENKMRKQQREVVTKRNNRKRSNPNMSNIGGDFLFN